MPVLLLLAGCGRRAAAPTPPSPAAEELDAALRPAAQVAALRRLGGVHLAARTAFHVTAPGAPAPADTPALGPDAVTTTSELWLDASGQYRLVESNDQDGGREIVRHGRDLAIALRYGKMIRRPAQEPEPTRYLEEAAGGPWAAWETVRRQTDVARSTEGDAMVYKLSRRPAAAPVAPADAPLRRWRDSVEVQKLEGEARIDGKTGALLAFKLDARFSARRDATPIAGEIAASERLDGIGHTPAVAAPAAEDLRLRQRTVLEERALLGDLAPGARRKDKEGQR
jgi:hypothetical protein